MLRQRIPRRTSRHRSRRHRSGEQQALIRRDSQRLGHLVGQQLEGQQTAFRLTHKAESGPEVAPAGIALVAHLGGVHEVE